MSIYRLTGSRELNKKKPLFHKKGKAGLCFVPLVRMSHSLQCPGCGVVKLCGGAAGGESRLQLTAAGLISVNTENTENSYSSVSPSSSQTSPPPAACSSHNDALNLDTKHMGGKTGQE